MLARSRRLEIRGLRLGGGVLLLLALLALFVAPALGAFALIAKLHPVLSIGAGILAGSTAYEPLQRLRVEARRAATLRRRLIVAGATLLVAGVTLRALVAPPALPLYDACVAAAVVVAVLVADRLGSGDTA